MVKLSGPVMSLDAQGSFAKQLTYAKLRETNYAKKYFVPKNPQSRAQTAHRLGVAFITQLWSTLSEPTRISFDALAETMALEPYHAFLSLNMKRWAYGMPPVYAFPIDDNFFNVAGSITFHKNGNIFEYTIRFRPSIPACKGCMMYGKLQQLGAPIKADVIDFSTNVTADGPGWQKISDSVQVEDINAIFPVGRLFGANGMSQALFTASWS